MAVQLSFKLLLVIMGVLLIQLSIKIDYLITKKNAQFMIFYYGCSNYY
jgi:hypothetical protein